MKIEVTVDKDTELYRKGQNLLDAAYEYWKQMQKEIGGHAVIWLEDDDGRTVFFTRGEYADQLKAVTHGFSPDPFWLRKPDPRT